MRFNPRPREAGDQPAEERLPGLGLVSIHARARRATLNTPRSRRARRCFNPRPREAGDASVAGGSPGRQRFNPRPREAGDDHGCYREVGREHVSIHARARRATPRGCFSQDTGPCFNPRPREAGDHEFVLVCGELTKFQSTPARGGRRFNVASFSTRVCVSIHARARRATFPPLFPGFCLERFQSTPARGGRLRDDTLAAVDTEVSIHARARRATLRWAGASPADVVSIHARARRATLATVNWPAVRKAFQSTPARGGRLHSCWPQR